MLNSPISSWRNQLISPRQNSPDYHREPSGAKRLQTIRMPALLLSLKSELSSGSSLWHDTTPYFQFPPNLRSQYHNYVKPLREQARSDQLDITSFRCFFSYLANS